MDECDLESHGVRRKGVPGSNPMWTGMAVDKMERMVLRDRNHACVFMWSLGNEAGDGDNFMKMKQAALKLDNTRPFHYEGDFDLTKTDVISRMYPLADTMEKLCKKEPITITFYDNIANRLAADSKPIPKEGYTKPVICVNMRTPWRTVWAISRSIWMPLRRMTICAAAISGILSISPCA